MKNIYSLVEILFSFRILSLVMYYIIKFSIEDYSGKFVSN